MYSVSNEQILAHTEMIEELYKKGLTSALFYRDFIRKVNSLNAKEFQPYEVKLPKSVDRLKKGDFEPERILSVESPFLSEDGVPMWTESSEEGINLAGFGYKNGDSRYPSHIYFNDTDIHQMLVGVTGHGKSVLVNSILFSIMERYAPWEVRFIMADAKVTEFKNYYGFTPPHITTIAATRDSDYIISVLEDSYNQMQSLNAVFAASGKYKNIAGFRKGTGLIIPRTVVVIDEFQTMKEEAQRKARMIERILDLFGRLGRNTGYHLLLSSQEPGDTPAGTMKNIKIRSSLGADAQTSTKILGNDEAKINFGKKGKAIVNTNSVSGDKKDNIHFRVPFLDDDDLANRKKHLHELGKSIGFSHPVNFYDGDTYMDEDEYTNLIKSKTVKPDRIILGEPSFIINDEESEGMLTMKFDGNDTENIALYCIRAKDIVRYSKMITTNMKLLGESKVINEIFYADKSIVDSIGFDGFGAGLYETRSADSETFQAFLNGILQKMLQIDADRLAFQKFKPTEFSDELLEKSVQDKSFITELNRSRAAAMLYLLESAQYSSLVQATSAKTEEGQNLRISQLSILIPNYHARGCSGTQLTKDKMLPTFYWIVGMDKMIGIGRSGKPSIKNRLITLMQDSHLANIRFICTMTDVAELGEFKSVFRFYIMDGVDTGKASRFGVPDYPDTVGGLLGVFFDKNSDGEPEALKFKKMAFNDEILEST